MIFRKKQPAFSLLELVVSLGAFTIIMLGTIQILAQGTRSYKGAKVIQTNLETAQFAINTIAKELRTSSVVAAAVGATSSTITFFDYSQNRCIQYQADESSGTLSKRSHSFASADPNANRSSCLAYSGAFAEAYESLLTNLTQQLWYVDLSTPMPTPHVGRVTVSLTIGTGASVQTTVSLRDFNYVGL